MYTKDNIVLLPDPVLRQRSRKIGYISDEIKLLAEQMQESTLDWENSREHELGVALAAVQLGQLWRIISIRNDFNDKKDKSFSVYLNPEITKYEGEMEEDYEGCLSVPDIYGSVPRYNKIRVKALALNGQQVRLTAEGFLARIFQHEIDHTHGIVFVDHIKDNPHAYFRLNSKGNLKPLNYDKVIKNSPILW